MESIKPSEMHQSMRGYFAGYLYNAMLENKDIHLITADLGYKMFDKIRYKFPNRFINCGASEQAGMGMAIGLALSDKIPFIYSITPFLLYRPFELIRNYISRESIPVRLCGSGRDKDYEIDGFSHDAKDIGRIMTCFDNIESIYPQTKEQIPNIVEKMVDSDKPQFLSLRR